MGKRKRKKRRQMLLANDLHTCAAEWLWLLEGHLTALSTLPDPARLVSASAVPRSSFRQRQHHSFLACAGRGKLYEFLTAGEYLPCCSRGHRGRSRISQWPGTHDQPF